MVELSKQVEEREEEICDLQDKMVLHVNETEELQQEIKFFGSQLEAAEARIAEL